jgi:hypothetical protein
MWLDIAVYLASFWGLMFFSAWFFWWAAAISIAFMGLGVYLANLEKADHEI